MSSVEKASQLSRCRGPKNIWPRGQTCPRTVNPPCLLRVRACSDTVMADDKSEKRGFAIFDRRHSANTFGVRRSVSNVGFFSSRRNSTPTPQTTVNGASPAAASPASTSKSGQTSNGGASKVENESPSGHPYSGKRHVRAEKWQLLARKVLGNLEEEDLEGVSPGGKDTVLKQLTPNSNTMELS